MEIRYIDSSDDKMKISKILEEGWRYAYRGIAPQDFLDKIPRGYWSNRLETEGMYTMVCINDGEYIGKGYGKIIMDTVINELRKECYKKVFLWVLVENKKARHFYENYGFEACEDYKEVKIGGKALMAVRYVITLPRTV